MDERRRLCSRVLLDGVSVAGASREAGVSRQTGSMWVERARRDGLEGLRPESRRPHSSPSRTRQEVEERLLECAASYPYWGPRKILWAAYGENPPVCERTAARILKRHGRATRVFSKEAEPSCRFERAGANELWQIDFKRLGPRKGRRDVLSVLDDATRFLVGLAACPDQTFPSVRKALWEAFGEHGLPEAVLSDNGAAFRNNATWRWSSMDLWLMLLGIRSLHSRPYHPQTQGKVERLHGTMEREGASPEALGEFRDRYNWARPHEAVGMRPPGTVYAPSPRARPAREPEPWFPEGARVRRTDAQGKFSYKGRGYRAGIAFRDSLAGIVETGQGPFLSWGGRLLCPLEDLLLP